MEIELMKKEEQYRKENEQLELLSKKLRQEVENVKHNIQENFSSAAVRDVDNSVTYDQGTLKRANTSKENNFYKKQIKIYLGDIQKLQNELKTKDDELKKLRKEQQNVIEEREKWFLQYNSQKTSNTALEKQITTSQTKLNLKILENSNLKKEIEQLTAQVKSFKNDCKTNEDKILRAGQEKEKLQNVLKATQQELKEAKDVLKREINQLTANLKQEQKQKTELILNYKKQMQLISNLKAQKACLESRQIVDISEQEFEKMLSWKLE